MVLTRNDAVAIDAAVSVVTESLDVDVEDKSDRLDARCDDVSKHLDINLSETEQHLCANCRSESAALVASVDDAESHLKVKLSIVCSLAEIRDFLHVTPKDIQWITDDMGVYYDVYTNLEWIVTIGD